MYLQKTGDNPADKEVSTTPSPLERFRAMEVKSKAIALLRKPGAVPPETLPATTRSGEIQIRLHGGRGKMEVEHVADITKISSLSCRLCCVELGISEEIPHGTLQSMVMDGQTKWVSKSMKIARNAVQVSLHRGGLKEFLLAAGLMKTGK